MNKTYRPLGRRRGALHPLCNILSIGVMRWPGIFALLALVAAVSLPARGARIDFAPLGDLPIIGVTPSKSTGANLSSRRRVAPAGQAALGAAAAGLAEGDSYDAIGLYTDLVDPVRNVFFLDTLPDTHTFGLPFDEDAGDNVLTNVPLVGMRIQGEDRGAGAIPNQQGTNLITVSYFTEDMSPLLWNGARFSPLGTEIGGWGLAVGLADPIEFGPGVTFEVHDSGIQFIDNTIADPLQRVVGDFNIIDFSTPPEGGLSGVGAAEAAPNRAAGIPIDEMVMYWDITVAGNIIPEPSTALLLVLGAGCLAVGRSGRRRHCAK